MISDLFFLDVAGWYQDPADHTIYSERVEGVQFSIMLRYHPLLLVAHYDDNHDEPTAYLWELETLPWAQPLLRNLDE